ncbi:hypothetical protein A0O34_12515 [Chryseobacterium glaciei]|uniref:Lipocalin-like domain-containing protein n=1 Tax=Chryseobacterium glaciei TaxID=1685010 RepID=A0A172XWU0_9FLAO|nr:lipocalin family protein [Chryseobacterium glaciei]ANF51285.1 hypothetical protein A0O34_12515 [Chryseobacterium glaciei]
MKYIIVIFLLLGMVSCSTDEPNVIVENTSINGNWKPYKYIFRGKDIMLNECESKGQLLINTDFSGVYERYGLSDSGNCNTLDSFEGNWKYDNLNTLILTYIESGATKTLTKKVNSYSDIELRINDNSKNLDNVPGNDEGILVYRKY